MQHATGSTAAAANRSAGRYPSRPVVVAIVIFLFVAATNHGYGKPASSSRHGPNIVLIVVDDLGWADLGCYGADLHRTPHLDRFASQAMRFTDAYAAAPVCSPTRAALMSGNHPARLHMTIWREAAENPPQSRRVIPPVTVADLPLSVVTIAEQLQKAGYVTAHIGKWHLGDAAHYPQTQGFDLEIGGTHWGCPATFFYPYRGPAHGEYRYVPGLGLGKKGDYLTDRLTDEAVRFIDAVADRPFFLYMAYYTVHTPIECKPELTAQFSEEVQATAHHQNATYAAMVYSMDQNVGRILNRLKQRGLQRNTVVILTSDNGGFINPWGPYRFVTNNAPLRSGKGSLYEGGIRVPLIIRAEGLTPSGSVCHQPVVLTDLYRTIIDLACDGKEPIAFETPDSLSLQPLLQDPAARLSRRTLYWHYPHYYPTTTPVSALREGNWKLLEYLEDGRLELYDLSRDLGEQENLAKQQPDVAARLKRRLYEWRRRVGAQMPTPNPRWRARRK